MNIKNSPSGRVITELRYGALVPHPPSFSLNPLANLLADANLFLGQVTGISYMLPNPSLLLRPFLRREAISSSRIEGTRASLSDLFLFETSATLPTPHSDVPEVHNYVHVLEYAFERLKTCSNHTFSGACFDQARSLTPIWFCSILLL